MSARRLLLFGVGRRRVVDDFDALSSRWVVQNDGSLAVAGGALQAPTLGDWLNNLIVNGDMETGDPPTGWTPQPAATISAAAEERTGGAGSQCLNVAVTETNTVAYQNTTVLPGATYHGAMWARKVDCQDVQLALIQPSPYQLVAYSGHYSGTSWNQQTATGVVPGTSLSFRCNVRIGTPGTSGRFDDATLYRQNVPALLAGWRSPNHVAQLGIVNPATAVTPRGWMLRYTSPLDYIEVRTKPNTTAEDLEIWEVVAGAEVFRGHADVDWTPNDVDELRVVSEGEVIGTEYRKSGAGAWTTGPDWTTTLGLGSPRLGPLIYGAAEPTFSYVRVEAR